MNKIQSKGIFNNYFAVTSILKKRFYSLYYSRKRLRLPADKEKILINKLHEKISSLPDISDSREHSSEDLWARYCIELKNNILTKDPREFLKWDVILKTMYHNTDISEINFLKSHPEWDTFKKAIRRESSFNYPPYYAYRGTDSNTVHHAYHIAQLMEHTDFDIRDLSTIFEFGGGYGNMCRLFFNLGFRGNYIIFDLPIFTALQEYYLTSLGLPVGLDENKRNITLISDIEEIPNDSKGLFIGTWSISEVPLYFRKKILKKIGDPDYFLLAYQNNFEEVDNKAFFDDLRNSKNNYLWNDFEINHLRDNRYLIGEKKGK